MNEFAYMDNLPSPDDSWDSAGGSGLEDEWMDVYADHVALLSGKQE